MWGSAWEFRARILSQHSHVSLTDSGVAFAFPSAASHSGQVDAVAAAAVLPPSRPHATTHRLRPYTVIRSTRQKEFISAIAHNIFVCLVFKNSQRNGWLSAWSAVVRLCGSKIVILSRMSLEERLYSRSKNSKYLQVPEGSTKFRILGSY